MNFEFNASARSLSTRKTGTIGIIMPDFYDDYGNSLYIGLLMKGIRTGLERAGFDSINTYPINHYTHESNIKRLINQQKVDGLLIINPNPGPDEIEFISRSATPFVFMHFIPEKKEGYNYVYTNHISGGFLATEHLIKNGRNKILCLTEPEHQFHERTEGYKNCLETYNIAFDEELLFSERCSFEFGYKVVKENPDLLKKIDSIFAEADLMALGAIEALKEKKIRVPEDIAVVGYDDIELGHYFSPKLTTIHQPREEHALLACSRLVHLINKGENEPLMQEITVPKLIIRESCGSTG